MPRRPLPLSRLRALSRFWTRGLPGFWLVPVGLLLLWLVERCTGRPL